MTAEDEAAIGWEKRFAQLSILLAQCVRQRDTERHCPRHDLEVLQEDVRFLELPSLERFVDVLGDHARERDRRRRVRWPERYLLLRDLRRRFNVAEQHFAFEFAETPHQLVLAEIHLMVPEYAEVESRAVEQFDHRSTLVGHANARGAEEVAGVNDDDAIIVVERQPIAPPLHHLGDDLSQFAYGRDEAGEPREPLRLSFIEQVGVVEMDDHRDEVIGVFANSLNELAELLGIGHWCSLCGSRSLSRGSR